MAIRMRIGNEEKFNANKMVPGEWAVSTDIKYVRMCFAPGVVARMATYEAFEEDMLQIQTILATCQNIQTAVEEFEALAAQHMSQAETYSLRSQSWAVGGTDSRDGEDTDNAMYYAQQAGVSANNAEAAAETALNKASVALLSEQNAATSALSAETSADSAALSADTAITKALEAATSAETANTKAAEASSAATSASTSATTANDSANAAAGSAQNASEAADRAELAAQQAESIAGIGIATTETPGIVKPDGTTIIVDEDGTVHAAGGGGSGTMNYEELENLPSIGGYTIMGSMTLEDIGIEEMTYAETLAELNVEGSEV